MKKRNHLIFFFLLLLTVISSCKTLNTDLSISKKKIPTSFQTSTDTVTIAQINWRNYFADKLLVNLIDTALANNFDLQIALQRIEVAKAGVRFTEGELLPKGMGGVALGLNKYAKYTQEFAGNSTTPLPNDADKIVPNPLQNYYLGLTTSWEIDTWGKLHNQRKSAVANYLASIEGKNFMVSSLVSEIAISYYELVALDNELEIIQQTIQQQQDALEVVQTQKEAGKANELAVQQFQSQLLDSQASEKEIQQQIVETENRINFLLGRYPQLIQRNKAILFQEVPPQIAIGIPAQLLSYRPDIREAELQIQASKFDLKVAKSAFFPSINISTNLGFQSFNAKFLFSSPTSIGYSMLGDLIAPLINRNALKAQFNIAKATQLTAMYNYQEKILNGYVEVINELSNIQKLQEINVLKKQQNNILTLSVETSKELYKSGRASYLEVLLAQQNSLQTQLELINTNKRQRIATVNIYKALGGGWR